MTTEQKRNLQPLNVMVRIASNEIDIDTLSERFKSENVAINTTLRFFNYWMDQVSSLYRNFPEKNHF